MASIWNTPSINQCCIVVMVNKKIWKQLSAQNLSLKTQSWGNLSIFQCNCERMSRRSKINLYVIFWLVWFPMIKTILRVNPKYGKRTLLSQLFKMFHALPCDASSMMWCVGAWRGMLERGWMCTMCNNKDFGVCPWGSACSDFYSLRVQNLYLKM